MSTMELVSSESRGKVDYTKILGAWIIAFMVVLFITPYVRKLAFLLNAVDMPNQRRINKEPIPGIGGLAILAGFWVAVVAIFGFDKQFITLFAGVLLIAGLGFVDDIRDLSPLIKFLGQFAAAYLVVWGGYRIDFIRLPFSGQYIALGSLTVPLTVLWIVGVTNAMNLIDGLDGLAAGTAGIASTTLLFVSLGQGDPVIAILLAALAGSSFGFLKYNFNPAQIFMGDTGSLSLGFLLAVISVQGLMKSATAIALAVPVLALGLPLADTLMAIIRRLSKGQSPFHADRGHLHHRLLDRGLNQRQAVGILYSISLVSGSLAVIIGSGLFNRYMLLVLSMVVLTFSVIGLVFINILRDDLRRNIETRG